jgi:DNA-binding GntR family transcriptional regulator
MQLRTALMRGQIAPGESLVHRTLATDMRVSPTPVREALLRLVSEGALELDSRGVAFVPKLDAERFSEIIGLRVELEGRAAAAAAVNVSSDSLTELTDLQKGIMSAKASGDIESVLDQNERFHFKIFDLAEMPVLFRILESLWMQCGPMFRLRYNAPEPKPAIKRTHPHDALLMAMKRKLPEEARAAIARDIEEGGAILVQLLARPSDAEPKGKQNRRATPAHS